MGDVAGELLIVSTPIGNLEDLSARARRVLAEADVICCEDTRRTRVLLTACDIAPAGRLVSLHAHNEASRAEWVLERVLAGARVAYVTDAGTPGVSDPGDRLVAAVAARGATVTAIPGPSAALAALVVSGLPTDRFCVEGFLPRKGAERRRRVAAVAAEPRTIVLFESAARIGATLRELADACGPRPAAVCRELTKLHEEVRRDTLDALADAFEGAAVRGEIVVVVGGAPPTTVDDDAVTQAVVAELDRGTTIRDTAAVVASSLGVSKRRAYDVALRHAPGAHD